MNVRVLGPLEASIDGRRAPRRRRQAARACSPSSRCTRARPSRTERLIEGLWGEQPPATATQARPALRVAAAQGADGDAATARRSSRAATATSCSSRRRTSTPAASSSCWREGEPREALALWRGPPLDDVAGEPFAAAEIRRLEELRLAALEHAIDADLAAGRHARGRSPSSRRSSRRSRCASACTRSACSRCTAPAARPTRSTPTARPADALVEQVGHRARARSCGACTRRSWPRTPRSRRRAPSPSGRAPTPRAASTRPSAARRASGPSCGRPRTRSPAASRSSRPARDGAALGIVACPFKGLASFDVDDAEVFFGRERLVAELVARLAGAPLMAVVGPSGSGKSSALRAGLLAALAAGVLPGSRALGDRAAAARASTRCARSSRRRRAVAGRAVVAVDQFEELFTACRDERERAAFVDALVERAARPAAPDARAGRGPRRLLRPLRRLPGAVAPDGRQPRAGRPDAPRRAAPRDRAARAPARGLLVEPELTDALVADVADEPGALPLLSSSLLELWQRRDGRRLRLAAYDQAGGVRGAVARLAERAYERLDAEQPRGRAADPAAAGRGRGRRRRAPPRAAGRARGRRRRGDAGRARRPAPASRSARARSRSPTRRSCASGRACAAGSRRTPRGAALHAHLIGAARDWEAGGRDPGELYRGARLAAALDWAARARELSSTTTERAFLDASRAGRSARPSASGGRTAGCGRCWPASPSCSRSRSSRASSPISQRGEARDAALAADAQRLGAQALTDDRLDHALLLARAGRRARRDARDARQPALGAPAQPRRSWASSGARAGRCTPCRSAPTSGAWRSATSTASSRSTTCASRRRVSRYQLRNGGLRPGLRFSPDSRTLAVAGYARRPREPPGAST